MNTVTSGEWVERLHPEQRRIERAKRKLRKLRITS
jgi:hypothetical protein